MTQHEVMKQDMKKLIDEREALLRGCVQNENKAIAFALISVVLGAAFVVTNAAWFVLWATI